MPIAVACQCGRRFSAKDELSGRTVACPACKRSLAIPSAGVVRANPVTALVPAAAVAARSVVVSYRRGQRFQAAAHLFGKTLNCPSCRAPLTIPNGPTKQPVAATPVDPLMGNFGTTQPDNDPFGLGMIPSTPKTFPSAGHLNAWETQVQAMIKSASVRITHSVKCSIAGHPGYELMFEQTENRTTTIACFRAFFLNDRAYTLAFLATKQVYQQAHADNFFNSFRLLNDAGPSQPAASVPVPTSLPPAVFTLSPPRVPSSNWQGDDIKEMDPGMLFALSK